MQNLEKEIREQPGVLSGVYAKNKDTIIALVRELKKREPNSAFFASRGTSDHAAIYAQYLFGEYLGLPCGLTTPSVLTKYNGKLTFRNSLVFGISQSGAAEDVLAVIEKAKKDGSLTVAVTNNEDSVIAKAADFHLYCAAGPETSIAATKTFTSEMYVLALLCAEWSGNEELKTILASLPAAAAKLMEYMPAEVQKKAEANKDLTDAVLLGRGYSYPIALEGALKILETNAIRLRGYAISDFQHGPLAQIKKGSFVFLIMPEGPVFDDAEAMLKKLLALEADVTVITDREKLPEGNYSVLRLPVTGSDAAAAYLAAITLQLFALKLTEARGIDPDASKVLKKVTVTF